MAGQREWNALLLGLVEVTQHMGSLNREQRVDVAQQCHDVVCGVREASTVSLGRLETGSMAVVVHLEEGAVQVLNDDYLVCSHKMKAVSVMAAIHKTSGHVVYIGWCQHKEQRLAVVLDMWSEQEADTLIQGYKAARQLTLPSLMLSGTPVPQSLSPGGDPERRPPGGDPERWHPGGDPERRTSTRPPRTPIYTERSSPLPHIGLSLTTPPLPPRKPPINLPYNEGVTIPPLPPKPPLQIKPSNETKPSLEIKPPPQNAIKDKFDNTAKLMKGKFKQFVSANKGTSPHYVNNITSSGASVASSVDEEKSIYNMVSPVRSSGLVALPSGSDAPRAPPLEHKLRAPPLEHKPSVPPLTIPSDNDLEWPAEDEDDFNYENDETYCTFLGISVKETERIYMKTLIIDQKSEATDSTLEDDIAYFLQNEYDYLSCLERLKQARRMLNPELQNLFRVTETLAGTHNDMYIELHEGYRSCSRIANAFITRKDELEHYAYYLMNAPKINSCIKNLPEAMARLLPTLQDDLRTSWKRLHFYFMSLEKMLGRAPIGDREPLKEAVEMLRDMNLKADSWILLDGVKESPFELLLYCPLILHNAFKIKGPLTNRTRNNYRVLLFAEIIVVTVPKNDQYDYQEHLPINQVKFIAASNLASTEFDLEIMSGGQKRNKIYTFRARSTEARDVWVEAITSLLRANAEKIKTLVTKRYGSAN